VKKEITFKQALIPIAMFISLMIFGLGIKPMYLGSDAVPVEVLMVIATVLTVSYAVIFLKYTWKDFQDGICNSIKEVWPGMMVVAIVGLVIGGFIMSGTLPMLIYYGLSYINPNYLYVLGFILPALFSTFTGTSWGSAGTIGVVLIGIGTAVGADLAILAGAIVSGSYFGDKMSPLSDTTNVAAIAAGVDLTDHIRSMLWSTVPSSLLCILVFTVCGFMFPPASLYSEVSSTQAIMDTMAEMFNFHILLLLPVVIVLVGSYRRFPTVPVMVIGSLSAYILASFFQSFTFDNIVSSFSNGFEMSMVSWYQGEDTSGVVGLLERGGIWELSSTLIIGLSIIVFISTLSTLNAMPIVVRELFSWAKTRFTLILSTLLTGVSMIAVTANGFACSFVTSDIFKSKYDDFKLDRKVLSRSLEDSGTLIEVLLPWTPAGIFFSTVLGVSVGDYATWAVLNLTTCLFGLALAYFNIGCYKKSSLNSSEQSTDTPATQEVQAG